MKIALLSFATRGGAGQYVSQFANGLSAHADVYSLVPSTHAELDQYDDSVNVIQFDTESYMIDGVPFAKYPLVARSISRYLQCIDPDIIHLPAFFQIPSIFSVPIVKRIGKPTVVTMHNPVSHGGDEIGPFDRDLMAYARMISTIPVDKVIVHGNHTYQQAKSVGYKEEKLQIIPHGIYSQFGQSEGRIQDSPHKILFFGHLSKYRGADRIGEIADRISARYEGDFQIKVAGSMGEDWQQSKWGQKTLANLRTHDKINLREEYIPESEVGDLFTDASIVLLPYYDATMSGVLMTAYSFATPIVATRTGDMEWMIEKDGSGLLAPPESTPKIADQVINLLKSDKRRENIISNIIDSREEYKWEIIGERTIKEYLHLRD